MKNTAKKALALILALCMVIPASLFAGVFAFADDGSLTLSDNTCYANGVSVHNGMIDGNLQFTEDLDADSLADVKVEVNGYPAYWNRGALGDAHCSLRGGWKGDGSGTGLSRASLGVGIVGAYIKEGENTLKLTDRSGKSCEITFNSDINTLGVKYSRVTYDDLDRSVTVKVIFNDTTPPRFELGDTFSARCHDEHDNRDYPFTVTDYDEESGMYTLTSDRFATTHTLLEMKCETEGDYKDYWFTATINEMHYLNTNDKITLSEATSSLQPENSGKLIDGDSKSKIEGNVNGEVKITFKADTSQGIPGYIALTTNDDGKWTGRLSRVQNMKVYGSDTKDDLANAEVVFETNNLGIKDLSYTDFRYNLNASKAYQYYTVVFSNANCYFQLAEISLYKGSYESHFEYRYGQVCNGENPQLSYEINTPEDLYNIANDPMGTYTLNKDITIEHPVFMKPDLSGVNESYVFSGSFDGNGHTITLNFKNTNYRAGVFAQAGGENCVIKDLTVDGEVTSNGNSTGGVVGTAKGDITFENITSKVKITSNDDSSGSSGKGGILGVNEGCKVTFINCVSAANITGNRGVGGFIGLVRNGGAVETFEGCTFNGTVRCTTEWSDKRAAGGFIGVIHEGTGDEVNVTFRSCASNGEVISDYVLASAWVGGYSRFNHPDQLPKYENCTQNAKVTILGYEISKITDTRYPEAMDSQSSGKVRYDAATDTLTVGVAESLGMAMRAETLAAKLAESKSKVYVNGVLDETAKVEANGRDLKVTCTDPTVKAGELVSVIVVFGDGSFTSVGQSEEANRSTDRVVTENREGANANSTDSEKNINYTPSEATEKFETPEGNYTLYYQTRKGEDGTLDYRFIVVAKEEFIRSLDSGAIEATFGAKKLTSDVTTAYAEIDATIDGTKITYTAPEGCVIMGVIIKGVPADIALDVTATDFTYIVQ